MSFRAYISVDWDASPRIITVAAPYTQISIQDLLDTCRTLESQITAMDNPVLADCAGKEQLGSGVSVGLTMTLQNALLAFEARPGSEYIQCSVAGGNLVALQADLETYFTTPISPTAFTQVVVTASSSATVSNLDAIQYSSYNGCVVLNVDDGEAGTTYPLGTLPHPVNNLADAIVIAHTVGVSIIRLTSSLTITTGQNITGLTFISDNWREITIQSGVELDNAIFERVSLITGVMSGTWNTLIDCWIYSITNFCGWLRGGSYASISLSPYNEESLGQSFIDSPLPMFLGVSSTLTMNTNTTLAITGSADIHEIHDMTAGSVLRAALVAGHITIDASCLGGTTTITGVGTAMNNSTLVVDTIGLVNNPLVSESVWQEDLTTHASGAALIVKDTKKIVADSQALIIVS